MTEKFNLKTLPLTPHLKALKRKHGITREAKVEVEKIKLPGSVLYGTKAKTPPKIKGNPQKMIVKVFDENTKMIVDRLVKVKRNRANKVKSAKSIGSELLPPKRQKLESDEELEQKGDLDNLPESPDFHLKLSTSNSESSEESDSKSLLQNKEIITSKIFKGLTNKRRSTDERTALDSKSDRPGCSKSKSSGKRDSVNEDKRRMAGGSQKELKRAEEHKSKSDDKSNPLKRISSEDVAHKEKVKSTEKPRDREKEKKREREKSKIDAQQIQASNKESEQSMKRKKEYVDHRKRDSKKEAGCSIVQTSCIETQKEEKEEEIKVRKTTSEKLKRDKHYKSHKSVKQSSSETKETRDKTDERKDTNEHNKRDREDKKETKIHHKKSSKESRSGCESRKDRKEIEKSKIKFVVSDSSDSEDNQQSLLDKDTRTSKKDASHGRRHDEKKRDKEESRHKHKKSKKHKKSNSDSNSSKSKSDPRSRSDSRHQKEKSKENKNVLGGDTSEFSKALQKSNLYVIPKKHKDKNCEESSDTVSKAIPQSSSSEPCANNSDGMSVIILKIECDTDGTKETIENTVTQIQVSTGAAKETELPVSTKAAVTDSTLTKATLPVSKLTKPSLTDSIVAELSVMKPTVTKAIITEPIPTIQCSEEETSLKRRLEAMMDIQEQSAPKRRHVESTTKKQVETCGNVESKVIPSLNVDLEEGEISDSDEDVSIVNIISKAKNSGPKISISKKNHRDSRDSSARPKILSEDLVVEISDEDSTHDTTSKAKGQSRASISQDGLNTSPQDSDVEPAMIIDESRCSSTSSKSTSRTTPEPGIATFEDLESNFHPKPRLSILAQPQKSQKVIPISQEVSQVNFGARDIQLSPDDDPDKSTIVPVIPKPIRKDRGYTILATANQVLLSSNESRALELVNPNPAPTVPVQASPTIPIYAEQLLSANRPALLSPSWQPDSVSTSEMLSSDPQASTSSNIDNEISEPMVESLSSASTSINVEPLPIPRLVHIDTLLSSSVPESATEDDGDIIDINCETDWDLLLNEVEENVEAAAGPSLVRNDSIQEVPAVPVIDISAEKDATKSVQSKDVESMNSKIRELEMENLCLNSLEMNYCPKNGSGCLLNHKPKQHQIISFFKLIRETNPQILPIPLQPTNDDTVIKRLLKIYHSHKDSFNQWQFLQLMDWVVSDLIETKDPEDEKNLLVVTRQIFADLFKKIPKERLIIHNDLQEAVEQSILDVSAKLIDLCQKIPPVDSKRLLFELHRYIAKIGLVLDDESFKKILEHFDKHKYLKDFAELLAYRFYLPGSKVDIDFVWKLVDYQLEINLPGKRFLQNIIRVLAILDKEKLSKKDSHYIQRIVNFCQEHIDIEWSRDVISRWRSYKINSNTIFFPVEDKIIFESENELQIQILELIEAENWTELVIVLEKIDVSNTSEIFTFMMTIAETLDQEKDNKSFFISIAQKFFFRSGKLLKRHRVITNFFHQFWATFIVHYDAEGQIARRHEVFVYGTEVLKFSPDKFAPMYCPMSAVKLLQKKRSQSDVLMIAIKILVQASSDLSKPYQLFQSHKAEMHRELPADQMFALTRMLFDKLMSDSSHSFEKSQMCVDLFHNHLGPYLSDAKSLFKEVDEVIPQQTSLLNKVVGKLVLFNYELQNESDFGKAQDILLEFLRQEHFLKQRIQPHYIRSLVDIFSRDESRLDSANEFYELGVQQEIYQQQEIDAFEAKIFIPIDASHFEMKTILLNAFQRIFKFLGTEMIDKLKSSDITDDDFNFRIVIKALPEESSPPEDIPIQKVLHRSTGKQTVERVSQVLNNLKPSILFIKPSMTIERLGLGKYLWQNKDTFEKNISPQRENNDSL